MTKNLSYPDLNYFFQAYFHQNWKETHEWNGRAPSFEIVVQDFRDECTRSIVTEATRELEDIIEQKLSEEDLRHLVNRILKCSIYAPGLGMTYQGWLEAVLAILKEGKDL